MAKKKSTSKAIDEALKMVPPFIKEIETNLSEDTKPASFLRQGPWIQFSRGEDGGLRLYGDEVQQYYDCLNAIVDAVDLDQVSKKAVDRFLKDAILAAIDTNNRRSDKTFEQRISDAISDLKKKLTDKQTVVQVHYRVSGLKPTFNPSKFGRVNFVVFDSEYFKSYKELIRQNINDENKRERALSDIRFTTEELLEGKTVAVIEVIALDQEAARNQALKELRLTLDVINFYSDILYPSKHAYASVFGEEERKWESIPVFIPGDNPKLSQYQTILGRLEDFSMSELFHGRGSKLGSDRISQILSNDKRSPIEGRLLSAMQWAGRATIDERNEEAFLLYAIALESLIMERGNLPELSYRLRMRVAHILGEDISMRKEIRKAITRLYDIRSAIVHNGKYIVSETELKHMRFFTKGAIMRTLIEEPFISMKSDNDLVNWFDEQML